MTTAAKAPTKAEPILPGHPPKYDLDGPYDGTGGARAPSPVTAPRAKATLPATFFAAAPALAAAAFALPLGPAGAAAGAALSSWA